MSNFFHPEMLIPVEKKRCSGLSNVRKDTKDTRDTQGGDAKMKDMK
jgi:hypothetical protein